MNLMQVDRCSRVIAPAIAALSVRPEIQERPSTLLPQQDAGAQQFTEEIAAVITKLDIHEVWDVATLPNVKIRLVYGFLNPCGRKHKRSKRSSLNRRGAKRHTCKFFRLVTLIIIFMTDDFAFWRLVIFTWLHFGYSG